MAMDNNPSSKRADVVFFALRLSYRLRSDCSNGKLSTTNS